MKKKTEKALKEYINYIIGEITRIVHDIRFFQIRWMEEKHNSDGGHFSIDYTPENYDATFYVYLPGLYAEIPDKGITPEFKVFVKRGLCHEAGHVYLWGLQGTKKELEQKATQIGLIIMELLDYKGIK